MPWGFDASHLGGKKFWRIGVRNYGDWVSRGENSPLREYPSKKGKPYPEGFERPNSKPGAICTWGGGKARSGGNEQGKCSNTRRAGR